MRRTTAARLRALLLGVIIVLYVLSIPWYREAGSTPKFWWGLPDWVTVAVLCYVAVAICNSAAWLLTEMSDEDDGEGR